MHGLTQFLRMSRWARLPPSWGRVKLVAAVLLICLALYAIDRLFGWPAWLTPNGTARGGISR
jgi:hypothetical protein